MKCEHQRNTQYSWVTTSTHRPHSVTWCHDCGALKCCDGTIITMDWKQPAFAHVCPYCDTDGRVCNPELWALGKKCCPECTHG